MNQPRTRRVRYFVDGKVQGALLARVAKYWLLSVAAVGCLSFFGWVFITPGIGAMVGPDGQMSAVLSGFAVSVVAAALMLPVVLIDLTRMSHRFAGPLVRLRHAMRAAAAGEPVDPIAFREGDFWQELADDFNAVLQRLEIVERDQPHSRERSEEPALTAAR